jgi:hypothetical protein
MGKSGNLSKKGTVQRVLYEEAVPVLKITIIWCVMLYSLVELYWCSKGIYSLCLPVRKFFSHAKKF